MGKSYRAGKMLNGEILSAWLGFSYVEGGWLDGDWMMVGGNVVGGGGSADDGGIFDRERELDRTPTKASQPSSCRLS